MQQDLVNFYQLLYHVTHVIFQVKSWSDSAFYCFEHWELEKNLLSSNVRSFLNLVPIMRIGNRKRISQSLSVLISDDPCCYLSSKKLYWLKF